MAKIKLNPDPTFKTKVGIPVPGGDAVSVDFTFKHRTKDGVKAWLAEIHEKTDAQIVADMACAWELDDSFDAENIERLCQNYGGAAKAIFDTYLAELRGARAKN